MWTLKFVKTVKGVAQGGFWLVADGQKDVKIEAVTLIEAYQKAVRAGYDVNSKQYIDEDGWEGPILFSTEVK